MGEYDVGRLREKLNFRITNAEEAARRIPDYTSDYLKDVSINDMRDECVQKVAPVFFRLILKVWLIDPKISVSEVFMKFIGEDVAYFQFFFLMDQSGMNGDVSGGEELNKAWDKAKPCIQKISDSKTDPGPWTTQVRELFDAVNEDLWKCG